MKKAKNVDTINRLEFLNALKKVKPGISTKDLIAEYAGVFLSNDTISSFSERMISLMSI